MISLIKYAIMKKLFFLLIIFAVGTKISVAQSDPNDLTKDAILENALKEAGEKFAANGNSSLTTFVSFSPKENTRGSRYLFPDWVEGSVTDSANTIYNNKYYSFNYDKISHNLYLTTDKKEVIEIDHDIVKSFTLKDDRGVSSAFERIPAIDPNAFFQTIVENSGNYSAYKLTVTKFEKANYITDGMVETGKNYDEYLDINQYYIGLKNGTEYKKVDLTKRALRKVLAENPKAEIFFSQHKNDNVDENFLKDLVNFVNKTLEMDSYQHKAWTRKAQIFLIAYNYNHQGF